MMSYWLYILSGIFIRSLLWLTRWEVVGKENVPRRGALLVVSNHLHNADPPLIALGVGRRLAFMAKEELFRNPVAGFFLRRLGAFPVYRGRWEAGALRQAQRVLQQGIAVAIFPEGKRSRSGGLGRAFPGAALVACRTGVPILPVGISGTEGLRGWWVFQRPRITVNIGVPFRLPPANGKLTREERDELANILMQHIAGLLPEKYRGHYSPWKRGSL